MCTFVFMEEKTRISYRTDAFTLRFDRKKWDYVKERQQLESPKEVADFLLDYYFYTTSQVLGGVHAEKTMQRSIEQPKIESQPTQQVQLSQYEAFSAELKAAKYMGDITDIIKEVRRDMLLNPLERRELEREATELSKNFYND